MSFRLTPLSRLLCRSAILAAALSLSPPALALDKGTVAPAIELPSADGTFKLSQYQGKVVYVDFWASWCGPCRQSFPWMNAMQAKYRAQGLQIVGINLDAKSADASKFLAETPAQFTVAFDPKGTTPRLYAVKGMPTSFLVGRDGKIISEHTGFHDGQRAELEKTLQQALGAK